MLLLKKGREFSLARVTRTSYVKTYNGALGIAIIMVVTFYFTIMRSVTSDATAVETVFTLLQYTIIIYNSVWSMFASTQLN